MVQTESSAAGPCRGSAQQQGRDRRRAQQVGGLAAEDQCAQRRMRIGAHQQHVDVARLDLAGDHRLGVAGEDVGDHLETGGGKRVLGPGELPGCVRTLLAGHHDVDGQALEQRAVGDHVHALARHRGAIEGEHHALGFLEAFGYGEDGLVHRADHALDVAAEHVRSARLRGLGRGPAAAEDEEAHAFLVLGQGVVERTVALAHVGRGGAGVQRAFAQAVEEAAALFALGARDGGVLVAELVEQVRLGVEADRAASARMSPVLSHSPRRWHSSIS